MLELLDRKSGFEPKPHLIRNGVCADIQHFVKSEYPFARIKSVDMYANPSSCWAAYHVALRRKGLIDNVGVSKRGNDVYLYRKDMLQP